MAMPIQDFPDGSATTAAAKDLQAYANELAAKTVIPPIPVGYRPTPRQSTPEQASSLTYLECKICARRSMFLRVDINTGLCTRCQTVSPPHTDRPTRSR